MSRWSFLAATGLSLALAASAPSAQCPGFDGLLGSCCSPVTPTLPPFPPISTPGLGICWSACTPTTLNLKVLIGAPVATPVCGQYTAPFDVFDTASTHLLTGKLQLDYTRTWLESSTPGVVSNEVWRFAAKADLMTPNPALIGSCPVPACLVAPTAFFYGYVDYAADCAAGTMSDHALVLYHGCDRFMHRPGISAFPGTFHPGTSYAIVTPHTTVNPFVPVAMPHPGGPVTAEAVRDVHNGIAPPPPFCLSEEPVTSGSAIPIFTGCACPLNFVPPEHTAVAYSGIGSCPDGSGVPSNWASINSTSSGLPWLHMMSAAIGTWTSAALYPGPERVWVDEGLFQYHDSCAISTAGTTGANFVDILYGATTQGGFTVLPDPVYLLTQTFVDLASNLAHDVTMPPSPPFLGVVKGTRHLVYTNLP